MSADQQSAVDNGMSLVAGTRGREMSIGTKIGILMLIGTVALGFVWFSALYGHSQMQAKPGPVDYTNGGEEFVPPPVSVRATPQAALPAPAQAQPALFGVQPQQSPASAPIMAFSGSDDIVPSAPSAAGGANSDLNTDSASPASSGPDDSPLAARLKPTVLDGEQATVLKNPDMVITEGTLIPCVLQTAIDSELPGLVDCGVPIDIRGSTGSVVLLDRGTKIVGQLQSGLLQGQNRVFVDWTRAETPNHVLVTLDSPGADELGRSGLPGAVDNHFWERFGGALMLTLVQGGLDAATIEAAGQGGTNSTSQQAGLGFVYAAQSNGQSVADTALQNTINIAPTLAKNQGDTVSLILAHDLDFSSVYQLRVNNLPDSNYGG